MPISATGNERGFTLIELVIVLAIIAVAATAVMLATPGPERALSHSAEKLAAQAAALRDEAVMASSPMAIDIGKGGYGFERYGPAGWTAETEKPFARVDLPEGMTISAAPAGERRIRFDATGLADPVVFSIDYRGLRRTIRVDAGGGVALGG